MRGPARNQVGSAELGNAALKSFLRDKLGAAGRHIQTVRGVGYRLADA